MTTTAKGQVTLLGVADVIVNRDRPEEMFEPTVDFMKQADIRFCQCEAPISEKGSPQLHGTRTRVAPRNLVALPYTGFNLVSLSGNHSLDWGEEALFDTQDRLNAAGIDTFGVGKDIEEAREPSVREVKGQKIAFLAYCSAHPRGYEADENKPGLVPLRATTLYEHWDLQPGTPPRIRTFADEGDLEAMQRDIRAARARADVVVLSIHWGVHFVPAGGGPRRYRRRSRPYPGPPRPYPQGH